MNLKTSFVSSQKVTKSSFVSPLFPGDLLLHYLHIQVWKLNFIKKIVNFGGVFESPFLKRDS